MISLLLVDMGNCVGRGGWLRPLLRVLGAKQCALLLDTYTVEAIAPHACHFLGSLWYFQAVKRRRKVPFVPKYRIWHIYRQHKAIYQSKTASKDLVTTPVLFIYESMYHRRSTTYSNCTGPHSQAPHKVT